MVDSSERVSGFQHAKSFVPGELSGVLGLGPLEAHYEELFAEALADGVITEDERARLEKAADNLGLDRQRLFRLEQAMILAYQTHHRVDIVEHAEPAASLEPLQVDVAGDPGRVLLQTRVQQLEARVRELEAELGRAQPAVNVDLTDVEAAADLASEDAEEVWRRVRGAPASPEPLRRLYRIYQARSEVDPAWCVAQALVALNAAEPDERAFYERHRAETLIAPSASLSQRAWVELLLHPEQELLTGEIFAAIAPAVLVGRVTALRRDGQLRLPPPSARQDPAESTITAVRALPWAAAILGLAAPPIYLERERPCGYEHLAAVPPVTLVGDRVLSGPTQLEHAFLVGRHLAFYRAEHFVKTLFSGVAELEDLFLAALTLGNPSLPIAEHLRRRVAPVAAAIEPLLDPAQKDTLRACFLRFVEQGGRTNLARFSSSVEKTACRAGLLVSGDLVSSARLLESEEGKRGELVLDLVAFASSARYHELRRQLGIAVGSA